MDGRAVGNPIKGFPFFTFSKMLLGAQPGGSRRHAWAFKCAAVKLFCHTNMSGVSRGIPALCGWGLAGRARKKTPKTFFLTKIGQNFTLCFGRGYGMIRPCKEQKIMRATGEGAGPPCRKGRGLWIPWSGYGWLL